MMTSTTGGFVLLLAALVMCAACGGASEVATDHDLSALAALSIQEELWVGDAGLRLIKFLSLMAAISAACPRAR